jgi:hypothetical protein
MSFAGPEMSTVAWITTDDAVGWGVRPQIALQQCGVCFGLVQESAAGAHINWHEEEGHLKP